MGVRGELFLTDYIKLWKEWESLVEKISQDECCKFWTYILQHRTKKLETTFAESLKKLPATSSDSDKIYDKRDVFVWYPKPTFAPLPRSTLSQSQSRSSTITKLQDA
ncbi:hypothetical protein PIB30_041423 [Stylosanthes scabra]|uniref:Uncharacterized protein n=1 Tax=Stylosanthes scabra TaxID=79078 RepID=A0ABU6VHU7_9FABA|nr:hypothetical protein [Stylosanthes scabra]